MIIFSGWGARARGLLSDIKGPWGPKGGGNGDEPTPSGRGGPWGEQPKRRRGSADQPSNVSQLDDFLRRSRARFGGGGNGGGGLPIRPDRSMIGWIILAVVLLWLIFSMIHVVAPEQRGVVSRFGRYSHTLSPGVGFTLPSPVDRVRKIDVENIHVENLPSQPDAMMLTSDQNIIDIDYSVRWNIRDPELYMYTLTDPDETIRQVSESAMRAVVARVNLVDAMGDQRGEIETQVREVVQSVLNTYRSGVLIQGVAIKRADPPEPVNAAFKEVSAAQQDAQSYMNRARAYALQLTAKAEGEAAAFDQVYEQYRAAPEVTRRRMYYETMEQVLSKVDKTIIEAPGVTPYLPLPQVQKSQPREGGQ